MLQPSPTDSQAVKEIGLDLEGTKAAVEILVIERAEKPLAN
jgi:uncharacterized protein (TIGR03435 family)